MSFLAVVELYNIYSLKNKKELFYLGETFALSLEQASEIDRENIQNVLWEKEIEIDEEDEIVLEFVRNVDFIVYRNDEDSVIFESIDNRIVITEMFDMRLHKQLSSLFEKNIKETLNSD